MDPLTGQSLGPYVLEERLGHGGMASVYRARHRQLKHIRAIKVMSATLAGHESFVQLFYREARLSARLQHPNIVQMYDIGEDGGLTYLVMELLEGRSLRDVIRQDGPLPVSRAVHFVQQLAAALQYAHDNGIAHRDVKPANAFISADDHLTLVDFGIARAIDVTRLTVTHGIGTPEYMPPESFDERRARPNASDHALGVDVDLYALGVVAYELLAGALPITARTPQAVVFAQVHQAPAPLRAHRPALSERLEAVIMRQLSKDPLERIGPPEAFAELLTDAALTDTIISTIEATGGPAPGRGTPPSSPVNLPSLPPSEFPAQSTPMPAPGTHVVMWNDLESQAQPMVERQPWPQLQPQAHDQATPALRMVAAPPVVVAPQPSPAQNAPHQQHRRRRVVALVGAGLLAAAGLTLVLQSPALLGAAGVPTSAAENRPGIPPGPANLAVTMVPVATAQATPQAIAQPPPPSQPTVPPAPSAEQRLRDAQATFAAGNYSQAIELLTELRRAAPATPGLDDTLFTMHLTYGQKLLEVQEFDASWGQFEAALLLQPQHADAEDGKRQIIVAKNWQQMEAAWSANPDAAINALDTILQLGAGDRVGEARQKLYALLIAKADRLLGAGDRDGAYTVLMKALALDSGQDEAQRRLAPYTPTPLPAAPPPATKPQTQPATQPKPQTQPATQPQTQPATQPATQPQQPLRMPGRPT